MFFYGGLLLLWLSTYFQCTASDCGSEIGLSAGKNNISIPCDHSSPQIRLGTKRRRHNDGSSSHSTPSVKTALVQLNDMMSSLTVGDQTLENILFDTGSSNLLVYEKTVEASLPAQGRYTHSFFDATSSSSSTKPDNSLLRYNKPGLQHLRMVFGDNVVTLGKMARAKVQIGSMVLPHTDLATIYKLEMEDGSPLEKDQPYDGIVGLGPAGGSENEATPPLIHMYTSGQISAPVFSLYLSDHYGGGHILFGGDDPDFYHGSISMVPVLPDYKGVFANWKIHLKVLRLGHSDVSSNLLGSQSRGGDGSLTGGAGDKICFWRDGEVGIDSGDGLLTLPIDVADSIAARFGAEPIEDSDPRLYLIECSNRKTSRLTLVFEIGDRHYTLGSETLILELRPNQCYLTIRGVGEEDMGGLLYVLGRPFLKDHYTVFSHSKKRGDTPEIGFAPSKHSASGDDATAPPPDSHTDATNYLENMGLKRKREEGQQHQGDGERATKRQRRKSPSRQNKKKRKTGDQGEGGARKKRRREWAAYI